MYCVFQVCQIYYYHAIPLRENKIKYIYVEIQSILHEHNAEKLTMCTPKMQ